MLPTQCRHVNEGKQCDAPLPHSTPTPEQYFALFSIRKWKCVSLYAECIKYFQFRIVLIWLARGLHTLLPEPKGLDVLLTKSACPDENGGMKTLRNPVMMSQGGISTRVCVLQGGGPMMPLLCLIFGVTQQQGEGKETQLLMGLHDTLTYGSSIRKFCSKYIY